MAAITTSADDALVLSGQGDRATPEALLRSLTASNATEQLSGLPRNLFFATNLSDFFSQWVESVFIGTNPARRDHRSEQPTRPSQATHQPSTSSTQPLPDPYQQQGRAYKRSRTPPPLPHTDNRPTSRYDGTTAHTSSHTQAYGRDEQQHPWREAAQPHTQSHQSWSSSSQQQRQTQSSQLSHNSQSSSWTNNDWQDNWKSGNWWHTTDWR